MTSERRKGEIKGEIRDKMEERRSITITMELLGEGLSDGNIAKLTKLSLAEVELLKKTL